MPGTADSLSATPRGQHEDAELRAALNAGGSDAVRTWLERDHRVADLLVEFIGPAQFPDRAEVLARAWEAALSSLSAPDAPHGGLRALLLLRTIDATEAAGRLDDRPVAPVPSAGEYLGADDRWAGWWADEPPPWPAGRPVGRAEVTAAVRLLPIGMRVVLVLRDAAGLSPAATADIIGVDTQQQEVLLEAARRGFLAYLGRDGATHATDQG